MDLQNFEVKDYSVTGEQFKLNWNTKLQCYETNPKPSVDSLWKYYQSENYISHTDRNKTPLDRIYHILRSYNLRWKHSLIEKHLNHGDKSVLDIGCGTGDFLQYMQAKLWNVRGIEPDDGARKIANEKINGNAIAPDEKIFLKENSFSCISMWHVLEHVYDPKLQSEEIYNLLHKNGIAVIAVPNYKSWDAKYYKKHWAAFDVPRHLWHFSKESIVGLFENQGFQLVEISPMLLDAFYVSLLSEKYRDSNFKIFRALRNGFISNYRARSNAEYSSLTYIFRKI